MSIWHDLHFIYEKCEVWNLQKMILNVSLNPYVHSRCSLILHIILLYLSIPHAFYFSFNTNCTIPAAVCPRQALIIYCLLIQCSTTFVNFSSVNLHNTHWRLTSSLYWWFPNDLNSAKSIFFGGRYSFVWNISVTSMKLWFRLWKGFPISNLDVFSRNGVNTFAICHTPN